MQLADVMQMMDNEFSKRYNETSVLKVCNLTKNILYFGNFTTFFRINIP